MKSVKSSPIKISLLIPFPTDRIRLRVLGTKDDALLSRQERARSGGRGWNISSRRAVGKIREIELYGYKLLIKWRSKKPLISVKKNLMIYSNWSNIIVKSKLVVYTLPAQLQTIGSGF